MTRLLLNKVMAFLKDEDGVTAIEYSLIAALIAVAIIGSVLLVGQDVTATFDSVSDGLNGVAPAAQ